MRTVLAVKVHLHLPNFVEFFIRIAFSTPLAKSDKFFLRVNKSIPEEGIPYLLKSLGQEESSKQVKEAAATRGIYFYNEIRMKSICCWCWYDFSLLEAYFETKRSKRSAM